MKPYDPPINDLGLPEKPYYTTGDLCKVLKITPDTFRQRIYRGYYPETDRCDKHRRFTYDQAKSIIEITQSLIKQGIFKAGA